MSRISAIGDRLGLTEISHLAGWRDSKPVRIGNGAAFHQQFDIYGELLDAIYLYNKYGKPVTWERWVAIREILGNYTIRCPLPIFG